MMFFIVSILGLVSAGLITYTAAGMNPRVYASTRDFANAKCSLYHGTCLCLIGTCLAVVLAIGQGAKNPGIEGYVPELSFLAVLLAIGLVILSLRIKKLRKMAERNFYFQVLEEA